MKYLMGLGLFLVFSLSFNTSWADAAQLRLGVPGYGGSGCPAGSASVILSPDQQSLSLLFDSFTLEASYEAGRQIDRKSCNIAIPVQVPQGYSISIIAVDYRGYNGLPYNALSQFNVEYFFAGSRGPRYSRVFRGPLNEDFLINNNLTVNALVWSPCGASTILRTNASMMLRTNAYGDQAIASVDSMDVQAGIVYLLQWRRCNY